MMRGMHLRHYLIAFELICIMLAAAGLLQAKFQQPAALATNTSLQALLSAYAQGPIMLDPQLRIADCAVEGPLPDHDCSPGAVFASATPEIICVDGYTKTVRSVSVSLKKKIYSAYGIAYPQPTGTYELDHLIPLELGGDNESANLFPEAANPAPGFREKDLVEDYLHQEVCNGDISLGAAQKQIATNWLAVYQTMTPSLIAQLKSKFKSWAN
jgi:hypothetical protein